MKAKSPLVYSIRELTPAEVAARKPKTQLKQIRDSHHLLARLCAMGLRPGAAARAAGYTRERLTQLKHDPAFKELVEQYRDDVNGEWKETVADYYTTVEANRVLAARLINDKLGSAEPEDVSFKELVTIHADAADRTGFPKHRIATNVNVDFAAKLDQAITASRKAKLIGSGPAALPDGDGFRVLGNPSPSPPAPKPVVIEHQPVRRRA